MLTQAGGGSEFQVLGKGDKHNQSLADKHLVPINRGGLAVQEA